MITRRGSGLSARHAEQAAARRGPGDPRCRGACGRARQPPPRRSRAGRRQPAPPATMVSSRFACVLCTSCATRGDCRSSATASRRRRAEQETRDRRRQHMQRGGCRPRPAGRCRTGITVLSAAVRVDLQQAGPGAGTATPAGLRVRPRGGSQVRRGANLHHDALHAAAEMGLDDRALAEAGADQRALGARPVRGPRAARR